MTINEMAIDPAYDTSINSAAITGIAVDAVTHTITVTGGVRSAQELYNYTSWWLTTDDGFALAEPFASIFETTLETTWNIVLDGVDFDGSLKTTGTVTLQNGATISGSLEDSAGVRVRLRFATPASVIAAREDTGEELGFFENTTDVTYTVPRGVPVAYATHQAGFMDTFGVIDTADGGSVTIITPPELTAVDATLDVSALLAKIDFTLDATGATITVNEPLKAAGSGQTAAPRNS